MVKYKHILEPVQGTTDPLFCLDEFLKHSVLLFSALLSHTEHSATSVCEKLMFPPKISSLARILGPEDHYALQFRIFSDAVTLFLTTKLCTGPSQAQ